MLRLNLGIKVSRSFLRATRLSVPAATQWGASREVAAIRGSPALTLARWHSQRNKKNEKPDPKDKDSNKNDHKKDDEEEDNTLVSSLLRKFSQKINILKENILTVAAVVILLSLLRNYLFDEITFDEAVQLVKSGNFEKLDIIEEVSSGVPEVIHLHFITKEGVKISKCLDKDILFQHLLELKKRNFGPEVSPPKWQTTVTTTSETIWGGLGTIIFIAAIIIFFSVPPNARVGPKMGVESSLMRPYVPKRFDADSKVKIRFSDVAGIDQTKQEIEEFVDFLKNPEKYKAVGAKLPKGALLSGPPGTGKTLLAKAVAGEAGVPFFFASGSEFVEMYVGLGAKRVRELFEEAKKHPSAIIFIDEIDSIGKKRSGRFSSHSEADATLNQLLVEMDGFKPSTNIVIFAATNRKDLLDPALVRPGRFDRAVDINLPDISARTEIFGIHLKPLKLPEGTDRERLARRLAALTPGFSGADIANICNEAAIHAVRRGLKVVENWDFEMAVERVIGGMPTTKPVTERERKIVSIHESGHGVISWFLKGTAPLLKLTIIPRSKGALGFAQYLPNEIPLQTEEYLTNQIIATLAGRAAEQEFFGKVSTGAYDDLQKAYRIARAIVTRLGMNPEIGQATFVENEYGVKEYSDATNRKIDEEVGKILKKCTEIAAQMARDHRQLIRKMSEALLEKETLDLKAIQAILGERPFPPESVFKAYLEEATAN